MASERLEVADDNTWCWGISSPLASSRDPPVVTAEWLMEPTPALPRNNRTSQDWGGEENVPMPSARILVSALIVSR